MSRRFYSRAHYRRVSPPADTQAEIIDRAVRARSCELGVQDRELRYPVLTGENADEAIAYQAARVDFHAAQLRAFPNWGRSHEAIERLVRGSVVKTIGIREAETEAHILAVISRIEETGECVWHASAKVAGKQCSCANCRQEVLR